MIPELIAVDPPTALPCRSGIGCRLSVASVAMPRTASAIASTSSRGRSAGLRNAPSSISASEYPASLSRQRELPPRLAQHAGRGGAAGAGSHEHEVSFVFELRVRHERSPEVL